MSKSLNLNSNHFKKPQYCWVGETKKTCYKTREEAEVAAECARFDHDAPELSVYKCEYGDHWHLSSKVV